MGTQAGKRTAGLLLAAGAAERMGTLKQLLPLGGKTLLERALQAALGSRLDSVALVAGHESGRVLASLGRLLEHRRLTVVHNPHYRQGMGSSIVAGLRAMQARCDHLMVLLADMPEVQTRHINQLLDVYLRSGLPLGALQHAGRRTHPVIFSRELFPELAALRGDKGGREIFERHAAEACLVEAAPPFDDRDIDTPEQYESFLRQGPPEKERNL